MSDIDHKLLNAKLMEAHFLLKEIGSLIPQEMIYLNLLGNACTTLGMIALMVAKQGMN